MPKNDALFLLIKSLNRSEKRYFRMFVSVNQSDKNHIQLFDFLDRMKTYDEALLRKKFRGKTFLNQLHVTKNYLTRLILKSLRNYHARSSVAARIKDHLRDVEILYQRQLYTLAGKALRSAERLAEKYDRQSDLLDVYHWQRRLMLISKDPALRTRSLNTIIDNERRCLDKLSTQNAYWELTGNIISQLGPFEGSDDRAAPPAHPLLSDPARADSFQSRLLYYYCLQNYFFMRGDHSRAVGAIISLTDYLEARPELIREQPESYITTVNNLIGLYLRLKQYAEVPELLRKIRAIPKTYNIRVNSPLQQQKLLQTYNVELELYRDIGDSASGIALINEIEGLLNKPRQLMPETYRLLFYYQFSYHYFLEKSYERSLHWLNEIFRFPFKNPRSDIISYAHLLRLIIHFELGNMTILKYLVDACRRFLKKKKSGIRIFEKSLLQFFAKASISLAEEYPDLLTKTYNDLFVKNPTDLSDPLDYLDFKSWLEQKLVKSEK